MASKEFDGSPIRIGLVAEAKASLEIKAEVPVESTGRFVDSLVDMFRPFSEARGLKADQIRLQREDVLIRIAEKAKQRALLENIGIGIVQNKFLIPFLEKASLEDLESDLVDRWSDLLLSASQNPNYPARYVSVLADLGPKEAAVLRRIVNESASNRPLNHLTEAYMNYRESHLRIMLKQPLEKKYKSVDDVKNALISEIQRPGGIVTHIFF